MTRRERNTVGRLNGPKFSLGVWRIRKEGGGWKGSWGNKEEVGT